jgi:hypothetical protein
MRSENAFRGSFLVLVLLIGLSDACADAPYIDPTDDEAHFGDINNILFWSTDQKVAGFRNMETLAWTRPVYAGADPYPLPSAKSNLSEFSFSYADTLVTLDDYLRTHNVAGLLVIKDGVVVYERYELGNSAESRWI